MVMRFRNDLLIYGLKLKDVSDPFSIGKFTVYPKYDLKKYLKGYEEDKAGWIIEKQAKLACYEEISGSEAENALFELGESYHAQVQLFLAAFRLFKAGWIQVDSIIPVIRAKGMKIIKDLDHPPTEQLWAEPMYYELHKAEIPKIQNLYSALSRTPADYLDVALKRFNRSYNYWLQNEIDDCFADLVIALESMTSRGGDGILQSMVLRIPLLLTSKYRKREGLEKQIKTFYEHRSIILHGGRLDRKKREQRRELLEDLRSLVRDTIVSCVEILNSAKSTGQLQKTIAETIDAYLHHKLQTT